jgi:multicomponent Na+:H+ antiporter subunit E
MHHGFAEAISTKAVRMISEIGPGVLLRFTAYLGLWLILIGFDWTNFAVGIIAAGCATWVSVVLLPIGRQQVSLLALARMALRLPVQSIVAGVDVARRALDPRMPLQPGFITYATGLPGGPSRNAFRALMSLQPGTLPVSVEETGDLLIHCLDTSQPIADQLSAEEALFVQVTGAVPRG